jgi:hypothetical protein
MKEGVKTGLIVAATLAALLGCLIGYMCLMYFSYWEPTKFQGRHFSSDFNRDLGLNSDWSYSDGVATINVYKVTEPEEINRVAARVAKDLENTPKKPPASVRTIRLRFFRERGDNQTPITEVDIPAHPPPDQPLRPSRPDRWQTLKEPATGQPG